jgi:hypothetical protein
MNSGVKHRIVIVNTKDDFIKYGLIYLYKVTVTSIRIIYIIHNNLTIYQYKKTIRKDNLHTYTEHSALQI